MGELLSDVLAAMLLGPAYIVTIAEYLIGTYKVQAERPRRVDRVPHSVRVQLLLRLHECGVFGWERPEPTFLLDQVRASVDEYDRINADIDSVQRQDWIRYQAELLKLAERGIHDFIARRFPGGSEPRAGASEPPDWAIVRSARASAAVRAYTEIWQTVDDFARASVGEPSPGEVLVSQLESLPEVRSFVMADAARAPARADEPPLAIETGESWSLDWFWLRARPPRERDGAQDVPPAFEQLGGWMREFAPQSDRSEQGTRGLYGLVLGASDGFVLRPFLRVRQDARINPDIQHGLAAYVERRALIEIVELTCAGQTVWKPGAWTSLRG